MQGVVLLIEGGRASETLRDDVGTRSWKPTGWGVCASAALHEKRGRGRGAVSGSPGVHTAWARMRMEARNAGAVL